MQCPICAVDLALSNREGIEIDYCPKCRGIWLDRGELDKIIERSEASVYNKSDKKDRYENDNYKKETHYNKKRKSSILGDLFDF